MLSNALKARFLAAFLATSSGVVIFSVEASYGDTIRHVTGKCLDIASEDGGQNGSRIQLWDCNGTPAQQFTFTQGSIRYVTGKCLDVAGEDGGRNGNRIQLWNCNGAPAQQFTLTAGGAIRHVGGKCLDVASEGGGQNGSRIQLWDCNGTPAQQLAISPSTESSTARSFPLRGSQFTELRDHRRMETSITISNNGRIDGVTRIWTANKWSGFTGAVAVVITDSAGNVLHVTSPQSYGVDCVRCPRPNDRTQQWSDTVPSNVLNQVGGYAIVHTTNSSNSLDRLRDQLRTIREAATEIRATYRQFGN